MLGIIVTYTYYVVQQSVYDMHVAHGTCTLVAPRGSTVYASSSPRTTALTAAGRAAFVSVRNPRNAEAAARFRLACSCPH